MFKLTLKDSGAFVGTINDADLQVLIDQLEEEHEDDTDYYICPATLDILEQNGASASLLKILNDAIGDSEGVEVAWQKA